MSGSRMQRDRLREKDQQLHSRIPRLVRRSRLRVYLPVLGPAEEALHEDRMRTSRGLECGEGGHTDQEGVASCSERELGTVDSTLARRAYRLERVTWRQATIVVYMYVVIVCACDKRYGAFGKEEDGAGPREEPFVREPRKADSERGVASGAIRDGYYVAGWCYECGASG